MKRPLICAANTREPIEGRRSAKAIQQILQKGFDPMDFLAMGQRQLGQESLGAARRHDYCFAAIVFGHFTLDQTELLKAMDKFGSAVRFQNKPIRNVADRGLVPFGAPDRKKRLMLLSREPHLVGALLAEREKRPQ